MILVDGEYQDSIPADDRGLAYGDGLFETIQIDNGRPVLWKRHLRRLQEGCGILGMRFIEADTLLSECLQLCQHQDRGIIKIILTRGSGGRGYRPDSDAQTRRIVSFHDWPQYPEENVAQGIRLYLCNTPVSSNAHLAGLKTLCRLEQVLAQMEWDEEQFSEGLMLDDKKQVIEGTRSNVFIVKDQVLITPALENSGIKGIMRDVIIGLAQSAGFQVQQRHIEHEEFMHADEIFICNSIIKIWPVKEYQGKMYSMGNITTNIMQSLNQHLGDYE